MFAILAPVTSHEARVRVRYAETDQMGVVHHANYLVWMEVARVDFCTALGFRYRDMEEADGVFIAVVESNCRYLRPARFDDEIAIRATITSVNQKMMHFAYEMRRDGELLATGFTKHMFVNREMGVVRLPERYWQLFGIAQTVKAGAI